MTPAEAFAYLTKGCVDVVTAEALRVLRAAKLRPARLRGVPVGWLPFVMRLPTPIVRLLARAQLKVDPEARSSMYEDLRRGRPTEVDDLNGEILKLAFELQALRGLIGRERGARLREQAGRGGHDGEGQCGGKAARAARNRANRQSHRESPG